MRTRRKLHRQIALLDHALLRCGFLRVRIFGKGSEDQGAEGKNGQQSHVKSCSEADGEREENTARQFRAFVWLRNDAAWSRDSV
jgi:hypothetical protein